MDPDADASPPPPPPPRPASGPATTSDVLASVQGLRQQLRDSLRHANTLQAAIDRQGETTNALRSELAMVRRANKEMLWHHLLDVPGLPDFGSVPVVAADVVETDGRAGAYALGVVLGIGWLSTVREGVRDESAGGGRFAIKIVEKARVGDYDALVSLNAEISFARDVAHENVVRLVDCFATPERVYLVLERGGRDLYSLLTLSAHLPEDHLTEDDARGIGRQLVAAVRHLAAASLAHGDVKPEHVLLDERGRATLTDLGSCRRFEEAAAATASRSSLGFAAPEALLGRPFDPFANDVFSVGAVLLECLVGVRWFAEHWLPVTPEEAAARAGPAAIDDGRQSFRSLEAFHLGQARSPPPPVLDANPAGGFAAAVAVAVAAIDRPLEAVRASPDATVFLRDALCVDVADRPTAETLADHAWLVAGPPSPARLGLVPRIF